MDKEISFGAFLVWSLISLCTVSLLLNLLRGESHLGVPFLMVSKNIVCNELEIFTISSFEYGLL